MLGQSIDTHHIIHLDLTPKLNNNCGCYMCLFGTKNRLNDVKHALTPVRIGSPLRDRCMIIPYMAFLLHKSIW